MGTKSRGNYRIEFYICKKCGYIKRNENDSCLCGGQLIKKKVVKKLDK